MNVSNNIWIQAKCFPLDEALEWESVMKIEEDLKDKKVLDFGCGAGRDLLKLAMKGASIFGIDLIQDNLYAASTLLKSNGFTGYLKQLDENTRLPFEDNTFDFIFCNGVLHHIPDADFVVQEFYRVLNPEGIIYIMLYTEDLFRLHLNTIENMMKNMPDRTWQRCFGECTDKCRYSVYYSVHDAISLFIPHGFSLVQARNYHDFQFRIHKLKNMK